MVTAVIVEGDFDVGLLQVAGEGQAELHVAYVQPALYPLAFVVGAYAEDGARVGIFFGRERVVEVLRAEE